MYFCIVKNIFPGTLHVEITSCHWFSPRHQFIACTSLNVFKPFFCSKVQLVIYSVRFSFSNRMIDLIGAS